MQFIWLKVNILWKYSESIDKCVKIWYTTSQIIKKGKGEHFGKQKEKQKKRKNI